MPFRRIISARRLLRRNGIAFNRTREMSVRRDGYKCDHSRLRINNKPIVMIARHHSRHSGYMFRKRGLHVEVRAKNAVLLRCEMAPADGNTIGNIMLRARSVSM